VNEACTAADNKTTTVYWSLSSSRRLYTVQSTVTAGQPSPVVLQHRRLLMTSDRAPTTNFWLTKLHNFNDREFVIRMLYRDNCYW